MRDVPTVLILIATERVSGPLKGIFQYLQYLDQSRYRALLGLVRGPRLVPSDAEREAQRQGLPYVVLEQSSPFDWRLIRTAGRLAREHDACIVQTHGYKTHLLGFLLRRTMGVPWVGFEHGWTAENWRVRAYHHLDWLLRFSDRVVAVSDELHGQLHRMGVPEARLIRVHNAVEMDEGWSRCTPGQFRQAQGIPSDAPLISVIGRITREKGQRVFVEAIARLRESVPQVHAAIVGEGADETTVREQAGRFGLAPSVHFVGWQRPVAPVYVDSDVIVVPSVAFEGVPNVLLEAMAAGRPVVATPVGGTPEVVQSERHALLVAPGEADAMARAVRRLLQDKPLRDRLVEQARARVQAEHSPAHRSARIAQIYDSLIAR